MGVVDGLTVAQTGYFPNAPYNTSGEEEHLVALTDQGLRLLQVIAKGAGRLHEDGSLRQATFANRTHQTIFVAPAGGPSSNISWQLPGQPMVTFASSDTQLAVRGSMASPAIPRLANGAFVVLDATSGKDMPSLQRLGNQGFHLGAIQPNASSFMWQAAPFGTWNVTIEQQIFPPNISVPVRVLTNAHGQWGGNVTAIAYAGSIAMANEHVLVAGFYGEGWNSGEANQFLVFDPDTGAFLGQFGVPE